MLIKFAEFIDAATHVAYNSQAKFLGLLAFAMMCADESYQTFCQTDKADTERTLIYHRLDSVGRFQIFRAYPQADMSRGTALQARSLLEVKAVAQLTSGNIEHIVKTTEETGYTLLLVPDIHTFDGYTHDVDCREAEIAASYRGLLAITVFKHTCTAPHGSHLVKVAVGVVGAPFLMLIECSVEIQEIGKNLRGCHLACQLIEVVVAVTGLIADSGLFLPYLYGEYRSGAVAYTLICPN